MPSKQRLQVSTPCPVRVAYTQEYTSWFSSYTTTYKYSVFNNYVNCFVICSKLQISFLLFRNIAVFKLLLRMLLGEPRYR